MKIQVVPVLSVVGETIPEFPAPDALEEMSRWRRCWST